MIRSAATVSAFTSRPSAILLDMAEISSSMISCSLLHVMPVANMPQLTIRSLPAAAEQKVLKVFSHAFCSSWA